MYSPDKIKTCLLVGGGRLQFEYISERSTLYLFNSDLALARVQLKTPQTTACTGRKLIYTAAAIKAHAVSDGGARPTGSDTA